jgi:hypothetical protein
MTWLPFILVSTPTIAAGGQHAANSPSDQVCGRIDVERHQRIDELGSAELEVVVLSEGDLE